MTDIQKAISLLKANGYAVIRREYVRKVFAEKTVPNDSLHKHSNDAGFIRHVRSEVAHALIDVINDDNVIEFKSTANGAAKMFSTTFEARLTVIPFHIETDPILEMIRMSHDTR